MGTQYSVVLHVTCLQKKISESLRELGTMDALQLHFSGVRMSLSDNSDVSLESHSNVLLG